MNKLALCILEKADNGVEQFQLYMSETKTDRPYGPYPIGPGFNAHQQIQDAINDAKDYGFDGIKFLAK